MPPLNALFALLGVEALALAVAAWLGRVRPGAVTRRRVECPISARPATIHVAPSIVAGAPPTVVLCSLLARGEVERCDRACVSLRPTAQPLRARPLRAQRLRPVLLAPEVS